LLTTRTAQDVASEVGVSERTLAPLVGHLLAARLISSSPRAAEDSFDRPSSSIALWRGLK